MHKKVFYLLLVSVLLTSCVGMRTTRSIRAGSFMPNEVRLDLTMDDFQYLASQEVSVSFKKYFGFINIFNEINKQPVARRNVNIIDLSGHANLPFLKYDTKLLRALYVALVAHPEADFVVPVSIVTEEQQMFMGRNVTKTMTVKLYKIKEK